MSWKYDFLEKNDVCVHRKQDKNLWRAKNKRISTYCREKVVNFKSGFRFNTVWQFLYTGVFIYYLQINICSLPIILVTKDYHKCACSSAAFVIDLDCYLLSSNLAGPFSHRPRHMPCLFAQTGPCHITPLWLQSSADNESHCRHVPVNKVWCRTHEAPQGWWWCSWIIRRRQHSWNEIKWTVTRCFCFYHGHHHRRWAPDWSVAVSTSCLHRSLSWASRHAEFSPWLSWVDEGLLPGSVARCDVDVHGGASSPWAAHELMYVGLWTYFASRPSVPCVWRNGAILF